MRTFERQQAFSFGSPRRTTQTLATKRWQTTTLDSSRNNKNNESTDATVNSAAFEPMENLYQEWTLEQDQFLWENSDKTVPELASMLGRGLNGVQARLSKLRDVNSPAYERLFGSHTDSMDENVNKDKKKLVPVGDILRRIQWDNSLPSDDFSILYYDRVDNTIVESPWNAENTQISGKDRRLIDALPEHRIVSVKYKDRVVWDRDQRIDLVSTSSSSTESSSGGIYHVIETYEKWKKQRNELIEWNRQRQIEVSATIESILGLEKYALLKQLSSDLQHKFQSTIPAVNPQKQQRAVAEMENSLLIKSYIQSSLQLFRRVREDPSSSLDPSQTPMNDADALDCLSELVALLPDSQLRPLVLAELSRTIQPLSTSSNRKSGSQLPELVEDELEETFVRGSGPGGQKVNKTSNRVVLVHIPTQLRVECQETRSLPQNRKIARKRLQLKLDDLYNGEQSRANQKTQKLSNKKQKAKARSRARLRKKKQMEDPTAVNVATEESVADETNNFY